MSWKKVSIREVTNNLDNKRKPLNGQERDKLTVHGLYPYIGANNIMGYVDEYLFDEEILCIAEDGGSWGKGETCAVLYNERCWVNNHAHVLTAKKNVDIRFLKYYLNYSDLNKFITGTTRGKLTKSALESILIPLPPLPIQQQIAAILDKADALRQKDQQLLQQYDALAQSIFYDMFGDPVKNEKGWEVKKLGELAENKDSFRVPIKDEDRKKRQGEFPYYGATGQIDWIDDYKLDGTFLLVAEDGKNLLFRKRKNAFRVHGKFWVNNHAHVLHYNGNAELAFLEYFINNTDLSPYVTGIDQFKLNRNSMDRIPVFVPEINLQRNFTEILTNIENQKYKLMAGKEKSESLFKNLLSMYM